MACALSAALSSSWSRALWRLPLSWQRAASRPSALDLSRQCSASRCRAWPAATVSGCSSLPSR
eukprot:11628083-Alexandrium_andersonii.AAC.1